MVFELPKRKHPSEQALVKGKGDCFCNRIEDRELSSIILEKKSEVKYAAHICLFVHPPLTPYSGR